MLYENRSSYVKDADFLFENTPIRVVAIRAHPKIELVGFSIGPFKEGNEYEIKFENMSTVCKYAVPEGYPENPVKNEKVDVSEVGEDAEIYYASVDKKEDGLYMTGSRAIAFIGKDQKLQITHHDY